MNNNNTRHKLENRKLKYNLKELDLKYTTHRVVYTYTSLVIDSRSTLWKLARHGVVVVVVVKKNTHTSLSIMPHS